MIFHCYNLKTNALIFKYSSKGDIHDCLTPRNLSKFSDEEGCNCGKGRYFIVKESRESSHLFAICFDNIQTRKDAKYYAKHTVQMFLLSNPIIDSRHDNYEEMVKTSIHNTKNLNSQITSKILSYFNEEALSSAKDKVSFIDKIVSKDTKPFAREVLSILRMSKQISNDYNVIDYLKPNIILKKNEFGYTRVHKLIVIAFYQFETDFTSRGIFVKINPTDLSVYVNYNTVQTILTHLFTNALRYCLENTDITINTTTDNLGFVEITFLMRSLYLDDNILKNGIINSVRSDQAKKISERGTGMGLGIINALCILNKGSFYYSRLSNEKFKSGEYIYSDNSFVIKLLKEEFYL